MPASSSSPAASKWWAAARCRARRSAFESMPYATSRMMLWTKRVLAALGRARIGLVRQELLAREIEQARLQRCDLGATHCRERREREALAQDRGVLQQRTVLRTEGVQTGGDERVEGLRDLKLAELARPPRRRPRRSAGHLGPRASGSSRRRTAARLRPAPTIVPTTSSLAPGAIRARGRAIAPSASGSRCNATKLRWPAPQFGRRSTSSGRASVIDQDRLVRDHSSTDSMKSSSPVSAHCRSSNTITTVPLSLIRSKNVSPGSEQLLPAAGRTLAEAQQEREARLEPVALLVVGHVLGDGRRELAAGDTRRIGLGDAGTHPHHLAERPERDAVAVGGAAALMPPDVSDRPSMYLSSSHARRDLPMPPMPVTDTTRALPSRPVACSSSLSIRSSSARPTNGGSTVIRFAPRRSATTRKRAPGTHRLLLALQRRGRRRSSKAIAREAARKVASPTNTFPGSAADWSREAVFTMSPVTMPWLPTSPATSRPPR